MTVINHMTYRHGKLLISIVERNRGEKIVALTKHAGAKGGTIALGRGTAESQLIEILGIGDTEKDIVFTLATDEEIGPIMEAIRSHGVQGKRGSGIAMLIDVPNILEHIIPATETISTSATAQRRRNQMKTKSDHVLITFIVNRGYADDAMVAARKAGATGGTILNARGTGKEEDVKFFGISLVPEKEILLIAVESSSADKILEAVKNVPCLSEPGSGIAFCVAVEDFVTLGKKLD